MQFLSLSSVLSGTEISLLKFAAFLVYFSASPSHPITTKVIYFYDTDLNIMQIRRHNKLINWRPSTRTGDYQRSCGHPFKMFNRVNSREKLGAEFEFCSFLQSTQFPLKCFLSVLLFMVNKKNLFCPKVLYIKDLPPSSNMTIINQDI